MEPCFKTNLEWRTITRGEDIDYFIETDSYPVNLKHDLNYMSRIQFPKSRAILVRTAPNSQIVTLHILRDIDLYSSFANFEIDLTDRSLEICKYEGYIEVTFL